MRMFIGVSGICLNYVLSLPSRTGTIGTGVSPGTRFNEGEKDCGKQGNHGMSL